MDAAGWLSNIDKRQEAKPEPLFGDAEMFVPHIQFPVREIDSMENLQRSLNPLHRHFLSLTIDLRANDALLLKEIQKIITKQRNLIHRPSRGMPRGKKPELSKTAFTPATFRKWQTNGIIPLRDLEIWANCNNTRFTDAQMGRWIFNKTLKPSRDINRARNVWREAVLSLTALRAHLQFNC